MCTSVYIVLSMGLALDWRKQQVSIFAMPTACAFVWLLEMFSIIILLFLFFFFFALICFYFIAYFIISDNKYMKFFIYNEERESFKPAKIPSKHFSIHPYIYTYHICQVFGYYYFYFCGDKCCLFILSARQFISVGQLISFCHMFDGFAPLCPDSCAHVKSERESNRERASERFYKERTHSVLSLLSRSSKVRARALKWFTRSFKIIIIIVHEHLAQKKQKKTKKCVKFVWKMLLKVSSCLGTGDSCLNFVSKLFCLSIV